MKTTTQTSLIQITTYGQYKKATAYYTPDLRFNSIKSRRVDIYTSNSTGDQTEDSIMCVDQTDTSDVYCDGINGNYNKDCYGCWSGCGHTVNYHNSHKKQSN